jgi:DNA-directed RNA polymerase subunit RPC12/RpoP
MLPFENPIVCPSCGQRTASFVTMAGGVEGHPEECVVEDWRCPNCGPFFIFAPRNQGWRGLFPVEAETEEATEPRHQHRRHPE